MIPLSWRRCTRGSRVVFFPGTSLLPHRSFSVFAVSTCRFQSRGRPSSSGGQLAQVATSSGRLLAPYRHRFSAFFFRELAKGLGSPYCMVIFAIVMSLTVYRMIVMWVLPRHERLQQLAPRSRVPMRPEHELMWSPSPPSAAAPSAGLFDPAVAVAESDPLVHRPRLIYAAEEVPGEPTGLVMEVTEYDPLTKDDCFYRSLHYLETSHEGEAGENGKKVEKKSNKRGSEAVAVDEGPYYAQMPGNGKHHIHGLVRCRRIEETEEEHGTLVPRCIPYAGDLSREVSRKLLLTLGPSHVLQDPNRSLFPMRFSKGKHPEMRALVIGLRGGELPRWLSTAYPNFNVDVVEPDRSLIRVVKRFFGFTEGPKLNVVPSDPLRFLRGKAAAVESAHVASERSVQLRALFIPWKKAPTTRASTAASFTPTGRGGGLPIDDPRPYDLVLIDALDSRGRLPSTFARLELLQYLRQVLSPTGCVAIAVPNRDVSFFYQVVQHWRMAFQGRGMVLAHCHQEPVTVLMTFQDEGGRGQASMGLIGSTEEMKDLIRSHLVHYGLERVPLFDLTREVDGGARRGGSASATKGAKDSSEGFFKILDPSKSYSVQDFLPPGHPMRLEGMRRASTRSWWEAVLGPHWGTKASAGS